MNYLHISLCVDVYEGIYVLSKNIQTQQLKCNSLNPLILKLKLKLFKLPS